MLKSALKKQAFRSSWLRRRWTEMRAAQAEARYRGWEQEYGRGSEGSRLLYTPGSAIAAIQERLRPLGLSPKPSGEFHSAIVTLTANWSAALVQELEPLGKVTVFDWSQHGFNGGHFEHRAAALNQMLLETLRKAHRVKALDWLLVVTTGGIILRETIRRAREEFHIPVIQMWLDCKQTFETGTRLCGQDSGQIDIAPEFDAVWTSGRSVCEWYMAIGARPLFLPEGFSPTQFQKIDSKPTSDIGFLGACYGERPDYVAALERAGLQVSVGGSGWPHRQPVPGAELSKFFSQNKVNLGMGGIGYSMRLTCLKGRDFEAPATGRAYLTTYNPELAPFFRIGEEIVCYQSRDEMVELARRLVLDDPWREKVAAAGYERCQREHRWLHRFEEVLYVLGLLARPSTSALFHC